MSKHFLHHPVGGELGAGGGCGRNCLNRQAGRAGGSRIRHHDQVGVVALEVPLGHLPYGELDVVLGDVGLSEDSLEPLKSLGAVQLVSLLIVAETLPQQLLDLLDLVHLRVNVEKGVSKR